MTLACGSLALVAKVSSGMACYKGEYCSEVCAGFSANGQEYEGVEIWLHSRSVLNSSWTPPMRRVAVYGAGGT